MKNINVVLASLMIIGLMTGCGGNSSNTNTVTEDPITDLYADIPDHDFPIPMIDGKIVSYDYVALPEEGYEVTTFVYGEDFMQSYQKQLKKAGFVDQGKVEWIESLWRFDRNEDGATLMVEMFHEDGSFVISMYVNMLTANSELDNLWTKLNGYWQYVMTDSDSGDMEFIFYYFGYDDNHAPFCNIVWGSEGDEAEYVTNVSKLDQHRYRITFEVPANHEEDGLFEVHDAYTVMRDYDLTNYSNKKITVEFSGKLSDWKYIGTEFPENLFE